jgi:N-dimethylarginine dimethylaminohydrolase
MNLNQTVLMTDVNNMGIAGINPYEFTDRRPNREAAALQFANIQNALRRAGVNIISRPSPASCPDGVYTANWAVTWNGRALLSRLPNARSGEEATAAAALRELGFETRRPSSVFSGQGDTLIFNDHEAILGHNYRTKITPELRDHFKWLGITPTPVLAKPRRVLGCLWRRRNYVTRLLDSYYYDIDLAVAVIAPNVLAVCLPALTWRGRLAIRRLRYRKVDPVTIIPVRKREARRAFACNLVSTGRAVVMAEGAPELAADLTARGYVVVTAPNDQFRLTGGGIRCITLALNN